MTAKLKLPPGQPFEIRPLLPAIREDSNEEYYEHMVTPLTTVNISQITIPRGVRYILVQATEQNIRYTITAASNPSQTSGFQLLVGSDPLAIAVLYDQVIRFIGEANGAVLQLQYCQ